MRTEPLVKYVASLAVLAVAIVLAVPMAAQTSCANGICTCNSGAIPPGNGEALHVVGACTVTASLTPYKFGDVNIYGTGASLIFVDPGDASPTDFWASSILVESGTSLNAGTADTPYGAKQAVLTIHLWGEDQGYSGMGGAGIACLTDDHCGIPDDIWNSNGSKEVVLPGDVTDYFYQYQPLKYDEKNPLGYFGYKVLAVSYNGTLALFGAKGSVRDPQPVSYSGTSWVRLNANAIKGSNQLTLDRLADWQPKDEIVVTSTDYMADHSEKVQVASMQTSGDGTHSIVTLMAGLQYPHHGQLYDLSGLPASVGPDPDPNNVANPNKIADVRAAVGLLSRSIIIKSGGNAIGEELDPSSYFGAHTVFRQGFLSVHIQGVEFALMGQGGRIMHYPVHFHMVRKTPANTVVEDCSVAESMTRWYVIHGTEGITLARNVGYESIGHGYYLEDGTETDNQLSANLGVFARAAVHDGNNTRQVPGILAAPYPAWNDKSESQEHVPFHSDIDHPTLFWMMNGWNDFQYNMAVGAGSCGACYWLVTGANSTMSRNQKWSRYGAEQSNVDRAGMTPLKSFVGNSCSGADNALNTISDAATCHGVVNEDPAADLPRMLPVDNPFGIPDIKSADALDYYPTVDRGGGRFATQCPPGVDCGNNDLVPRCNSLDPNCMVTVLDHFTTSFNYSETNFGAIWLRPQWYLFLNSVITDVQNGGLTFVTGGGYTESDLIKGHWALATKSAFIGTVQNPVNNPNENNFASIAGPFNPDTGLACAKKSDGAPSGLFCLDQPNGMLMSLSNFGMNQRFFSIYDGPSYQESNAYLNIVPQGITGCDINNNNCSNSKYMYGQVLGLPLLKSQTDTTCYMPNAAIAWKQPNGFYYPPAFHSDNLFFNNVSIRHYVIEPLFSPKPTYLFETDSGAVKNKYCVASPTMFDSFTDIDRQTELNDDNGSLTGLVDTVSVNEDPFFNAPVEDYECHSDILGATPRGTAKTSPYDYATTVIYSDHGQGVPGIWDKECATNTCFGVPLHRLYLVQDEINKGAAPPRILMMGQSVGQRSTLSVNHGDFYIDTTQSLAQQQNLRAGQVSVFEGGHTYYNFLLFAKPTTRQTYSMWVGPGFDLQNDVKAYQVDIKGAPPTFTETAWPLSWPQPTYDSSTGLLTVTMDMNFTDFQNGYTAAKEEDCQPASFCTLNSSNSCGCALSSSDKLYKECKAVCGKWAGHDVDCPVMQGSDGKLHSTCYGFGFTLPQQFVNGTPHTPKGLCYPDDSDWNVNFTRADQATAGSCYYTTVPTYQTCKQRVKR